MSCLERVPVRTLVRVALLILPALAVGPVPLRAQSAGSTLLAGDSVRVDGVLIGRVVNVEGTTAMVLSREKPRCRAAEGHAEAPVCDPAPLIRRQIDLTVSTVERRVQKGNPTTRTILGGLIGTAAFGAAGYLIGPSVGFGKVEGCLIPSITTGCRDEDVVAPDVLEARQRRSDQTKGALFFGVIGGTATAILARKLSSGWVRLEPTLPTTSDEGWGLRVEIPGVR